MKFVFDIEAFRQRQDCAEQLFAAILHLSAEPTMPTLKIMMMLYFGSTTRPFPDPWRTSSTYVKFVRQLLAEGMIERPTKAQRRARPGWAYRATAKGRVYIDVLTRMPQPIPAPAQWIMPDVN